MKSWVSRCVWMGISLLALSGAGCKNDRLLEPDPGGAKKQPANVAAAPGAAPAPTPGSKIKFRKASPGDVPALVKTERAAAKQENRGFLVYVGATWCEPCQRFHEAAGRGELDAELPALTLLEFDADNDTSRLRQAGYASSYIPLFAVAGEDGRASGRYIEGGIKGERAAKELVPRLTKLLQ